MHCKNAYWLCNLICVRHLMPQCFDLANHLQAFFQDFLLHLANYFVIWFSLPISLLPVPGFSCRFLTSPCIISSLYLPVPWQYCLSLLSPWTTLIRRQVHCTHLEDLATCGQARFSHHTPIFLRCRVPFPRISFSPKVPDHIEVALSLLSLRLVPLSWPGPALAVPSEQSKVCIKQMSHSRKSLTAAFSLRHQRGLPTGSLPLSEANSISQLCHTKWCLDGKHLWHHCPTLLDYRRWLELCSRAEWWP